MNVHLFSSWMVRIQIVQHDSFKTHFLKTNQSTNKLIIIDLSLSMSFSALFGMTFSLLKNAFNF